MKELKKTVLIIDDDEGEFQEIKSGLEPVYQTIPKANFNFDVDTKNLFENIKKYLYDYKEHLVGIILDVNLKDHKGEESDISGVTDILPAIRNTGDFFSIIPIIILTKFTSLKDIKENAFYKNANYFIEKEDNLTRQAQSEIRWVLHSLGSIYENIKNRVICGKPFDFVEEGLNELINKCEIIFDKYTNPLEMFKFLLNPFLEKIEDVSKKQELTIYLTLQLLPSDKRNTLIKELINEIKSEELRAKILKMKNTGKNWVDIITTMINELGINIFANMLSTIIFTIIK